MKHDIVEIISKISAMRDKAKTVYETLDSITKIVEDDEFWDILYGTNPTVIKEKDYD